MTRLFWYAAASLGPIAAAGAQFVVSLWILRSVSPAQFGTFSFLLLVLQLCFGFSSALLCATYPILFHDATRDQGQTERMFLSASLAGSVLVGLALAGTALFLGLPVAPALLFGGYSVLMMLRWFARAHAYVRREQWRTVLSDVLYGVALVAIAFVLRGTTLQLEAAVLSLLLGAVVGVAAFGPGFLARQFAFSVKALRRYTEVWMEHSRWSLLGVLTTEATANAHAYLVTLIAGPTAFAPIAASSLLFRPVQLAQNALTDYERPAIARRLNTHPSASTGNGLGLFRFSLFAVWVVCAIASIVVTIWRPTLIFPAAYQGQALTLAVLLWTAITGIRAARTPESTLLQAAGRFKPLASASVVSCGASIVLVLVLVLTGNPILSMGGVLIGEAIFAQQVFMQSGRYYRQALAAGA